jgi:hypothetical protein
MSSSPSISKGDSASIPRRCLWGKTGRAMSPLPYGFGPKNQGTGDAAFTAG